MNRSEQIDQIATALAKAQGLFPTLQKRSKAYNYMYADLAEIMDCVRDPLANNGMMITHDVDWTEPARLVTTLFHNSGQWISCTIRMYYKADGKVNEMQAMGSALTYAKRYSIGCLLNLAADKESDDDGVKAAPKVEPAPSKPQQKADISIEEAVSAIVRSPMPVIDITHLPAYFEKAKAAFAAKGQRLDAAVASWLERPEPFLKSYEKFCIEQKIPIDVPSQA